MARFFKYTLILARENPVAWKISLSLFSPLAIAASIVLYAESSRSSADITASASPYRAPDGVNTSLHILSLKDLAASHLSRYAGTPPIAP